MPSEVVHYTTAEVAARFGVNPATVRRWVIRGVITPAITTPGGHHRFTEAELAKFMSPAVAS